MTAQTWNAQWPWSSRPLKEDRVWNAARLIFELSNGFISTNRLHQILYFCLGKSLKLEEPLFEDRVEAWWGGPVIIPVYQIYGTKGFLKDIAGDPEMLSVAEMALVSDTVVNFRHFSDKNLAEVVRATDPYSEAAKSLQVTYSPGHITHEDMAFFFNRTWD